MDGYPLLNSLRVALISCAVVFFTGIAAAYYTARLPKLARGFLDVVLTLPLVLPPTVVGYFLLRLMGPRRPLGLWILEHFGVRMTMTWYSAVFASVVVSFPLMYRTARGAFESFDRTLEEEAKTLGASDTVIFWSIRVPCCSQGLMAGTVLSFARALGEYGATSMIAGYTPGRTATISTTVYQLWRTGNDALAMKWVLVNLAISFTVLTALNLLERRQGG
ncbi:MAG: molybdate ABC transporter permease subunit [Fretibacterium sp.]|nr:molybdate ABC transporter permease subunit [Fretibacterium sp.]